MDEKRGQSKQFPGRHQLQILPDKRPQMVFFTRTGLEWMIRQHALALLGLVGPQAQSQALPNLPRGTKVWWEKSEADAENVMKCETGGETMIETSTRTEPFQDEHNEWMTYIIGSKPPVPLSDLKARRS
ncbi:MAG: hypothetical protein JEY79_14130 [Pseudodesulfovibrio sp.]|nr:hypothetical protein [Pseudodesulfovibrio sp.]